MKHIPYNRKLEIFLDQELNRLCDPLKNPEGFEIWRMKRTADSAKAHASIALFNLGLDARCLKKA